MRFFFPHPNSPFVGASDIGHESHWPETGDLAWESNPGPIKKSYCLVRGSNLGPTKLTRSCTLWSTK